MEKEENIKRAIFLLWLSLSHNITEEEQRELFEIIKDFRNPPHK